MAAKNAVIDNATCPVQNCREWVLNCFKDDALGGKIKIKPCGYSRNCSLF